MNRHNRHKLRDTVFGTLFEQEEKEATEDPFADKEEATEKTEETEETEDDKEKDEKDSKLKMSAEDIARLGDSIDNELETLLVDYETDARKSAQLAAEKTKVESFRWVYKQLLHEVAADDIDLHHFANNLSRLVKNYDTLMDMESIILNKAYAYVQNNYGADTVKALKDVLSDDFDISLSEDEPEQDEQDIPIAADAGTREGT
jgi:hypothetical protein